MKNFRKVLALVLVVATLFSFAAMASAKTLADYKDADKVTTENYEVAIDVLSALEILDGYEDETFKPTNTITRAEMAKMIAVLANAGDADVDKLYAAACNFADVDKVNDWFASYVSYCAYTGIVSGRSADTFDPYGKVTGIETAKMLLVTMGFSADEQGYKGANWKINVLRDAQNFGLLEGFAAGYDVDAAITREEAANMMLNALKAPVVIGVLSENIVKITNALYQAHGVQATLIDAEKYGWVKMYGNVIIADKDLTLGEALYNGRLDVVRVRDCYGRPGTQWTLKNKKGTVVFEGKFFADPMVATDYTGEIVVADVIAEEFKLGNYSLNAYVDGKNVIELGTYNGAEDKTLVKGLPIGRGVLVEVYVNDALKQITVVVINTYIGEVTATLKASNRFEVKSNIGELCFSNKGYDFEQGDMILFWLCGKTASDLHDAQIVEPTTAAITRAEKNNKDVLDSTFTAGKVFEYALAWFADVNTWNIGGIVGDFEVGTSKNYDATWDIYTDLYGYAMHVRQHVEAPEYLYAYVVEGSGYYEETKYHADGTIDYVAVKDMVDFTAAYNKDVAVHNDLYWDVMDGYAANGYSHDVVGSLVQYVIDDDGLAVLCEVATAAGPATLNAKGDLVTANKTIYGNGDTKYLVRTWNYETEAYEYNAYTEDTLPAGYLGMVLDRDENELIPEATIQYFSTYAGQATSESAEVLTYVFIDAQFAFAANRALILDVYKSVTDTKFINKIGACDYYEAVVNGTPGYVILTQEEPIFAAGKAPVLIETELEVVGLMDDGLPVYAAAHYVRPNAAGPFEFVAGELVNGNVSWDMEDDFFAVIVDPAGDAHVFTDAAELNAYVESMEAWIHATFCDKAADGEEICEVYAWLHAWQIDDDNDNVIDELYAVIDTTAIALAFEGK